jgi:RNA polymerase sigma factor FliA
MTRESKPERISPEAALKLWKEYKGSGDPRLRDRLVLTFAPMVKYIVYRKIRELPARCEADDFISCGLEALIRSIDRYDPEKGATIEQFAWTRIHGAVLDELRRHDWAPRSLRRWERDINRARERFTALYGRRPTKAELSDAVGISVAQLVKHLEDIAVSDVGSLNSIVLTDDDTSVERITMLRSSDRELDPEYCALRQDARERFQEAFDRLSERDRQVAVLLHVNNLTLREIGVVLGVSESRVCQIHRELKGRLRKVLAADKELFSAVA